MTPFYFGGGGRRLFGAYHPAAFGSEATRAAVLCHPSGGEYLNAHRTMLQLAAKLAAQGFHTLRFDYFGTGDSAGDAIEGDIAGWPADIEAAMDEIRDIAATTTVTLIGLRLGALAAARVAVQDPGKIDALVLWDPIARDGVAGVPAAELDALLARYPGRALMLSTAQGPARTQRSSSLDGQALAGLSWAIVEDVEPWTDRSANAGLVPVKAIQQILTWLA